MSVDMWKRPEWAQIEVVDDVEWSATSEPRFEESLLRLDVCPEFGGKYAIHVLALDLVEDVFWVIFRPALSALNGWDEAPEEIEKSAIVEVKVVQRFLDGWIRIEVLQVVGLSDIARTLGPSHAGTVGYWARGTQYSLSHAECGSWRYVDWNCQSDAGYWLLWRDSPVESAIVMYGYFMTGERCRAYAGNRVLTSLERDELANCH
jgi:hypothetical protein